MVRPSGAWLWGPGIGGAVPVIVGMVVIVRVCP